jgi:alpha-ribazole phosphatase
MRVGLIRHPAALIKPGVCYGRLDVAAQPFPEDQIGRIAAEPGLCDTTCIWTSPARRCHGLAVALALALAVPLRVDLRLQELDFGAWEGQKWDGIPRRDLDRWAASPCGFAPPGGESGADLMARVGDFHMALRRDAQDCIVVTHGGPLKVLTALLLGMKVDLLAAAPPLGTVRIVTCPAP